MTNPARCLCGARVRERIDLGQAFPRERGLRGMTLLRFACGGSAVVAYVRVALVTIPGAWIPGVRRTEARSCVLT